MDVKHLTYLLDEIARDVADARKLIAPRVFTDHQVRPRPQPLDLSKLPAGGVFLDPVFGSRILRVTDSKTAGGFQTWRTSSGCDRIWNADGTLFFVENGGGSNQIFKFDPEAFTVEHQESITLNGPTWHQDDPTVIYGRGPGERPVVSMLRLVGASAPQDVFDVLNSIAPIRSRPRTYIRGIAQARGALSFICGGTGQDTDDYCVYIAKNGEARILDLDDDPRLQTLAHFSTLDLSGRFVIIGSTVGMVAQGRAIGYVWDTVADTIEPMNHSAGGHGAVGWGSAVNAPDDIDSQEYRFRAYDDPDLASLINQAPPFIEGTSTPWAPQFYQANHITWNNAKEQRTSPFVVGNYRYMAGYDVTAAAPWRPWDEEIIRMHFDGTVERFAHHQSDVRHDAKPMSAIAYWSTPRPKVDASGRYALFTSNWGKTLGAYPLGAGDGSAFREDVFLVELGA